MLHIVLHLMCVGGYNAAAIEDWLLNGNHVVLLVSAADSYWAAAWLP